MNTNEDILSFMDLLDLDEDVIDQRANKLMEKSNFSYRHLNNFIRLLQYKHLINIRENSECDNEVEYNFIGKLITNVHDENVDAICKIITAVLTLNPSTITFKSEHLMQQILSDVYLPKTNVIASETEVDKLRITLMQLKICGSILNANEKSKSKISLLFLSTPLERIICSKDENLFLYFLTNTVPQFFSTVDGYNILDRIWDFLKQLPDEKGFLALRVICCLSNYFLPIMDSGAVIESNIMSENKFWDFILHGLSSEDTSARKQSLYLAKRAIDYMMKNKKNVNVTSESQFIWNEKNKASLKKMWDDFFILIDSLEEKQSNIVLPSLKIFDSITDIGRCWMSCAFNIGLKHDNTQVRLKCLQYHLQYGIHNDFEALIILKAINDILNDHQCKSIMDKLNEVLKDNATLLRILKILPLIKWSPVPLYHVTKVISNFNGSLPTVDQTVVVHLITNISKVPCNNVIIRKCIHVNLSYLIGKCCKNLNWREYIHVYSSLQLGCISNSTNTLLDNPFQKLIKENIVIPQKDMTEFFKYVSVSYANIDFALLYFEEHEDIDFLQFIHDIIHKIEDISKRQYCDKAECIKDTIFVVNLFNKALQKRSGIYDKINHSAMIHLKILLQYITSLLISDVVYDVEDMTFLFKNLDEIVSKISNANEKQITIELFKSSLLCLQDMNTVIDKKVLSIYILCNSLKFPLIQNYKQEILDVKNIIEIIVNVEFVGKLNKENSGRLRNAFYEKACEIVNILLNTDNSEIDSILSFIDVVIESGGYGCLKWILRILYRILPLILNDKNVKFNVIHFLNRMWTEIEELKSNSEHPICMIEFVKIITQDSLLKQSIYNNIVLMYCSKIIEYAPMKSMPLYFLVEQLTKVQVSKYSHMVYVLSETLLNPLVTRKDNRIIENVLLEILQEPIYGIEKDNIYFNSHLQFLAVSILSKISNPDVLNSLTHFMIKKIDEMFKNKQRYHNNSQLQRTLQACLQNLLFILLKSRKNNFQSTALWCMELLGRIPHQPFERACLEWYTSLYFYIKESIVNEDILNQLKANNVPLLSQFTIIYWIVIHKLKNGICLSQEYEFLMNFLLSHIMGPVFSLRLQAQYLSSILYEVNEISRNKLDNSQYVYMIKVINGALQEIAKAEDKNFKKLKNDYFMVGFDIVEDLIPCQIYWILPQLVNELSNDIIEDEFLRNILKDIESGLVLDQNDKFGNEWKENHRKTSDALQFKPINIIVSKEFDNLDNKGTIQKKYVPWKNMSDIDVHDDENKKIKSELIVVASLIDKLPNLGGIARTSEVFAVQTYVVDSLRHLQDRQFQGLSVSAEKWVNVEEVRPGQPLKDYLMIKKAEGYAAVAAEQTSSSTKLQNFRFPKKTLLLLGNEKEGVPCDLLPLMDHCVEIPQQGVIRSLNVHVTAAIFIWEYATQNVL